MSQTKAQLVEGLNINPSAPSSALSIDATGNINLDSNTLYIDATNNRVGLGTSSPTNLLTVSNGSAASLTLAAIENSANIDSSTFASFKNELVFRGDKQNRYSGSGAILGPLASISTVYANTSFSADSDQGAGALTFSTRARTATTSSDTLTEHVRIDDQGRVGIGTTSPSAALDVYLGDNVAGTIARFGGYNSGRSLIFSNSGVGGDHFINAQAAGGTITFQTGSSDRVKIDSSGRLLIGTSTSRSNFFGTGSADPRFQVEGTDLTSSLVSIVRNSANTSPSHFVLGKSRGASLGSYTVVSSGDTLGLISFQGADGTNLVPGASIYAEVDGTPGANDMPGRLVFSTTADGASSPTERMRINNTGDANFYTDHTNVHIARSGNAAGTTDSIYVGVRSATSTINGTVVYRVYTNGTYATISDANQKKNIETTRDGYLEDLNKLRVVKYNWNEQDDSEPKELGLIAQEVEEVFPGLVTKISESSEESEFKGIKTSVLPYMLLKALQEATTRIETLEAEIAALKAS